MLVFVRDSPSDSTPDSELLSFSSLRFFRFFLLLCFLCFLFFFLGVSLPSLPVMPSYGTVVSVGSSSALALMAHSILETGVTDSQSYFVVLVDTPK